VIVADAKPQELAHRFAVVDGVRLHYVEAGRGPLVVLLHGFPQYWYLWRRQLAALAAAGFRAVALDMRGYNLSDKPAGVASYRMGALVADVVGLVRHLGAERASVVGHDWGGAVAWAAAMRHPEVVERLVVLNAPHPLALAREVRNKNWRQLWRSSYVVLFQLPWLPEAALRAGGFTAIRRVFREEPVRPNAFADEDVEHYVAALREPGALHAAVNYYRAAVRHRRDVPPADRRTIAQPTLLVWGDRDPHLGVELAQGLEAWVPALRVEHLPEASHWVLEDAPERATELIVGFLSEARA
jgi:epoxide hydrolase 4